MSMRNHLWLGLRHFALLIHAVVGYCVVNRIVWPLLVLAVGLVIGFLTFATYAALPYIYTVF